jgi:DNA-binding GntR family transcriptional regulator
MALSSLSPSPSVEASFADQAYGLLRDRLVMLDIRPGTPMNEMQLAAELGMGRTPIRESLKRLEVDHLVVSYPRQGTFASRIDIRDLAAISEMRVILEPLAARKAAVEASDEDRQAMAETAAAVAGLIDRAPRNREMIEYDLEAHRAIYRAINNLHLRETLLRLDNLATRLWWTVLDRVPSVSEHIAEHVTLLDAIVAGRDEEAARLAYEHVTSFEQSVRDAL